MQFEFEKYNNKSASLGMATVVACSGIMANQANAAVIFTDVNPDAYVHNSTYNYDLNNDGTNDFYLTNALTYGAGFNYNGVNYVDYTYTFSAGGYNGNQVAASTELQLGDTVDASLGFTSNGMLRQYSVDYDTYVTVCYDRWGSYSCTKVTYAQYFAGAFTNDGYLGLEFNLNGETYYGWSNLSVNHYAQYGYLLSYAYEDHAGKAIQAGHTYNPDTVNSVPEPGSLALLATGAAGIAALRRRKKKQH